jgi:hypothetical protein
VALVNRQGNKNNFNFCICFLWNLCYGVYIPVDEVAALVALLAGSKLRHWPPGTNSKTVRAVFFCAKMARLLVLELAVVTGRWATPACAIACKSHRRPTTESESA